MRLWLALAAMSSLLSTALPAPAWQQPLEAGIRAREGGDIHQAVALLERAVDQASDRRRDRAIDLPDAWDCRSRHAIHGLTPKLRRRAPPGSRSREGSRRPSMPSHVDEAAVQRLLARYIAVNPVSTIRFMKASHWASWSSATNSLGRCAWAMSPGPQMTVGTPIF